MKVKGGWFMRVCLLVFLCGFLAAQQVEVKEFCLPNGAKLLVVERPTPTVAVQIWFRVGSVNDPPDIRGAAHLIEHLLFNGTPSIGTRDWRKERPLLKQMEKVVAEYDTEARKDRPDPERLSALLSRIKSLGEELRRLTVPRDYHDALRYIGAITINGSTSFDWTSFYCQIPAAHFEHWALAEADRFCNPTFRCFWEERQIVLEEMRQRIFDNGWGRVNAELRSLAFRNHPYRHPIIGYHQDVRFASLSRLRDHFRRFYCGANMVVVVVGGVKAEETFKICRKHLGRIPKGDETAECPIKEPHQEMERRSIIRGPWAPRLAIAFRRPQLNHPDFPALEVLGQILAGGHTSRLYLRLVKKDRSAAYIAWSNRDSRYPELLILSAMPEPKTTPQKIEKSIWDELEKIKKEGVSDAELERAKRRLRFRAIYRLCTNSGLARWLGFYEVVGGSWRVGFKLLERIERLRKEEIREVARRYLRRENSVSVWMLRR